MRTDTTLATILAVAIGLLVLGAVMASLVGPALSQVIEAFEALPR